MSNDKGMVILAFSFYAPVEGSQYDKSEDAAGEAEQAPQPDVSGLAVRHHYCDCGADQRVDQQSRLYLYHSPPSYLPFMPRRRSSRESVAPIPRAPTRGRPKGTRAEGP